VPSHIPFFAHEILQQGARIPPFPRQLDVKKAKSLIWIDFLVN
jgi:hypothetical protein